MLEYSFTFENLEFFLLVFIRIATFVYIAPFFQSTHAPRRIRAGFSLVLAYILYSTIQVHEVPEYSTVIGYSALVLKEAATGLLIGMGANMCETICAFAGKVADMEIGLSMVSLLDPLTNTNTGFTGSIYQYALILIMLVTNMHYFFIKALVETFNLIPVGMATFASDKMLNVITKFMVDYLIISFRICLPIVACMLLLNAILGILAKTAPQMNMFSVGIQIKVLVGLGILFLTIGTLPNAINFIFDEMKIMVTAMVEAIS